MAPRAAKSKASKKGSEKSSSSGSPPPQSTSPTVRERVGNYELVNLSKKWDNNEIIRDSVRENHNLLRTVREEGDRQVILDEYVEGNTENVKANREVLDPIMEIMGQHDKLIPNLDNLIQCIDAFYRKAKKPRFLEHCYQMAWAIRRLIQVVKSVCYRPAPPEDRRVYYKQGCDTFDEMVGYKYVHFNKCLIDKYFGTWVGNFLLLVFWSKATCTNMHQSYITNLLMFGALVIPYVPSGSEVLTRRCDAGWSVHSLGHQTWHGRQGVAPLGHGLMEFWRISISRTKKYISKNQCWWQLQVPAYRLVSWFVFQFCTCELHQSCTWELPAGMFFYIYKYMCNHPCVIDVQHGRGFFERPCIIYSTSDACKHSI